jgi:hypothetical protein
MGETEAGQSQLKAGQQNVPLKGNSNKTTIRQRMTPPMDAKDRLGATSPICRDAQGVEVWDLLDALSILFV